MQLIAILLVTVSILTIMSGIAVFFGSSKSERSRSAWFLVATVFAAIWTLTITGFLMAPTNAGEEITWLVEATYLSGLFIDIALLGYICWKKKTGKALTMTFVLAGVFLAGVFLSNPHLLYKDIILSPVGNSLTPNIDVFYFVYIAFFCALVPAILITLFRQILKTTSRRKRAGDIVLLVGFAISGTVACVFNLILPLTCWDYVWLGPLAISTTIIAFYYAILRYRTINLSSNWLKTMSYIVLVASAALIYMIIFFVIFAALFRGSTPSTEVIVLNFIMILIVLLMSPMMSELSTSIRSLLSTQKIDMVYIIERLSKVTPQGADLKELAAFLSDHMHFEYVGFLIDGQVFGSSPHEMSDNGIAMIEKLGDPEHGAWQEFDETTEVWQHLDLSAVAALRDANGKTFGQFMVGKPLGKVTFNRRDMVQIETIINLVAVIIDSRSHKK